MVDSEKEEIFKKIINQHKNQIHRICWGFTKSQEDIKDLFQDVIINIWKGFDGFKSKSSYSTWIHRITINTCILWKKKSNYFNQSKEINSSIPQSTYDEIKFEADPRLIQLKEAINQLKSIDKTIILLTLEEVSHKKISEITGLSISNIGVKVLRIKTQLKKLISQFK